MQRSNQASSSKSNRKGSQEYEVESAPSRGAKYQRRQYSNYLQTLAFEKASKQTSQASGGHREQSVDREWGDGRSGQGASRQKAQSSAFESPMLQRWQKENAREQPWNDVSAFRVEGLKGSARMLGHRHGVEEPK